MLLQPTTLFGTIQRNEPTQTALLKAQAKARIFAPLRRLSGNSF